MCLIVWKWFWYSTINYDGGSYIKRDFLKNVENYFLSFLRKLKTFKNFFSNFIGIFKYYYLNAIIGITYILIPN